MQLSSRAYGTWLFVGSAVASLIPVVALGAALAGLERDKAAEHALDYGRAQAAVIEEMAIAPALGRGGPLHDSISVREDAQLLDAIRLAINDSSVMRLWVSTFDGDVVFSDTNQTGDALSVADPAFVRAAAGATEADLIEQNGAPDAIRVLRPIRPEANGQAVGVLELHLPYAPIAAKVDAATRGTYWYLALGLGALWAMLAGLSWSSTRRLRRHAREREHEAEHDPLTGLPNRKVFRQRLEDMLRHNSLGAVVLLDLDRFKEVNDSLGHHAGDELLRVVAERLQRAVRGGDTVSRLGGDEFGLLLPSIGDVAAAHDLAARARAALAVELELQGVPLSIEASFGIALHPSDASTAESLLRCADAAMYQGKSGTQGVVLYEAAHAKLASQRLSLQADMRRAIDRDELRLHYQPKIDLKSGLVVSVEALVRWQHPDRGLLAPAEFLPAIEQTGLIDPFTDWVLSHALADCAAWTAAGETWCVAVNVSARNLDAARFPEFVATSLRKSGIHHARLQLEVTETAMSIDQVAAKATLETLASYGIGVALDDFGMGYASLAHLRTLPLTEVKVDRGFVSGIENSESDREIVRSLVQLAHGLGLYVTAEGVENAATARWLLDVGCDSAQGYYFSRPVPWTELCNDDPQMVSYLDPMEVPT